MPSKEEARQVIAELVEKYRSQIGTYEGADYNEEDTRIDFINPFFAALGWDVGNTQAKSESYRDVQQERKIVIEGKPEFPDYAFKVGKEVVFYVEAKKPAVNIFKSSTPAFQLRRYGWSTPSVSVSILSNFKQFAVYDCRPVPNIIDKAEKALLYKSDFEHYLGDSLPLADNDEVDFDFIWDTFSKESVEKGKLDAYIASQESAKGILTVDQSFLKALEDWRLALAASLLRTNSDLTETDLNLAVQQILDRIVFLRIAEDRFIEPYNNLAKAIDTVAADECYKRILTLFHRADEKYNSGVFDFDKDKISERLTVKNDILKKIVNSFYFPSPYEFSVIPVEMLGTIYERFLGSTLTVHGKSVKDELKPEVRKTGGVFYTPQFIVDYIVKNTVGELVNGRDLSRPLMPKEVAKLKIVDPACGSGSFLLGAYQYLLDWHTDYYRNDYLAKGTEPKGTKADTLTPAADSKDWQLTATEKKRVLLNNIFGVDIDPIAVEVAKLSLLLKCMEGETATSIENTQRIFHEKVLPNIDGNIRCGNALISNDFYQKSKTEFTEKEQLQINAFDWETEFPQVFKQGGFDVVIGNPPYVKKEHFSKLTTLALQTMRGYTADLYVHFIMNDYRIAKQDGLISLIVNDSFMGFKNTADIRKLFFDNDLQQIVKCPAETFTQATIYTAIFVLCKRKSPNRCYETYNFVHSVENQEDKRVHIFTLQKHGTVPYQVSEHIIHNRLIIADAFVSVFSKFAGMGKIGDICSVLDTGMHTGNCRDKLLFKTKKQNGLKKVLQGRQIERYRFDWNSPNAKYKWCNINYEPLNKLGVGRGGKKSKQKEYWHWCGDIANHLIAEKVLLRQTDDDLITCYVNRQTDGLYYTDNTLHTVLPKNEFSLKFILGILNSKLLNRTYHFVSQEQGKSMAQVKTQVVESLPFPPLDLSQKPDKQKHDQLVKLVDTMLKLKEKAAEATMRVQEITERQIAATDKAIDLLVYQLYGLTAEEITLVEETDGNKTS
jgi:type I restriction-modification system DNA methylase subunit